MTIQTGDFMPDGEFFVTGDNGVGKLRAREIFGGKKVVLFGVPGAFTSTCSKSHLPGFVALADQLRAKGVDTVACLSVNDAAVMHAWGTDRGVGDKVLMLADGNADYVKAIGLDIDSRAFGMGIRSRRFAAVIEDGKVIHLALDEPGQFANTKAERILEQV